MVSVCCYIEHGAQRGALITESQWKAEQSTKEALQAGAWRISGGQQQDRPTRVNATQSSHVSWSYHRPTIAPHTVSNYNSQGNTLED